MDAIVEVLLEKETMTGDEFRAVLSKYATMPQVRRAADAHSPRSSCITASLLGRAACTSAALGVLPGMPAPVLWVLLGHPCTSRAGAVQAVS